MSPAPSTPIDLRHVGGPFDIIGDVHGCLDELVTMLERLGYRARLEGTGAKRRAITAAPAGRIALFVGDIVDRGPATPDCLRVVMAMVAAGQAHCVPGNHDDKFLRRLKGHKVTMSHGLEQSVAQMATEPPAFHAAARDFIAALPIYLWLDGGRLIVTHAGLRADMIGQTSRRIRSFCLYGDSDGEIDAYGLAVRYHWALDYAGEPAIVYGHTPVPEAAWVGNTLCIDTGVVFGNRLTSLRWPEREIVTVPAARTYVTRQRPLGHPPPRPVD